jgi:hypothetical protein
MLFIFRFPLIAMYSDIMIARNRGRKEKTPTNVYIYIYIYQADQLNFRQVVVLGIWNLHPMGDYILV